MVAAKKRNFKRENDIVGALPLSFFLVPSFYILFVLWMKIKKCHIIRLNSHTTTFNNSMKRRNKKIQRHYPHIHFAFIWSQPHEISMSVLIWQNKTAQKTDEKKANRWKADNRRAKSPSVFISLCITATTIPFASSTLRRTEKKQSISMSSFRR